MTGTHFILVEKITEANLVDLLTSLTNLYGDTGFTNDMELYRQAGPEMKYLVSFRNDPDLDRFAYFVNYMKYPMDMEVPGIRVTGYYLVPEKESYKKFRPGEWLQVYISPTDKEYDNASIVNAQNETCLLDFGGRIKDLDHAEEKFQSPDPDRSGYQLIRVFNPDTALPGSGSGEEKSKPWWKFW